MKEFTSEKIRNLCLAGQRGCGKTSVADAIAHATGVNNRIGRVDDGSSFLDYMDDEISRKTTLSSKLMACEWKDVKLNLLDCPGHADFIGELLACARVADAVGFVVSAPAGVEVGTQMQWKSLDEHNIARFFFVNKCDAENVNWKTCLDSIKTAFGKQVVAVELPIVEGESFKGLIDLLTMKAYDYSTDGERKEIDIPANLKDDAEAEREALIEVAAEADDDLLEKFFEDGTLSDEDIVKGIHHGIDRQKIYPVLFGAATGNMGIQVLLDFVATYLPAPNEMGGAKAFLTDKDEPVEVSCDSSGKPLLFIFKTLTEGHLGEMAFFRNYSGTISSGANLKNQRSKSTERAAQIYTMQGKNRLDLGKVVAGDIGILVKLKDTNTGDTLSDASQDISLPPVVYPNPVMDVSIKPKARGDEEKVGTGLNKLAHEDPSFKVVADGALHQTVLWGQGATHVEIITKRLKDRFGVEVDLLRPRIPYRETIKGKTEKQYRHKKQSGGRGQFGDVHLRIEPNKRGAGFEFIDEIKGGVIPSKFIPAVEKGVVEAMENGGLAGSQVVDVKVALFYGSYHDVDSSDMAFKIAGLMAFKEGFMECKPVLLEPIYSVEILVPDDFTGDVMGDLSSRRGKIAGMDPEGGSQRIRATVPQAEMYQYSVDLRSMTQGQGVYSMAFSHYEEVPRDAAQKVIEMAKAASEDDKS